MICYTQFSVKLILVSVTSMILLRPNQQRKNVEEKFVGADCGQRTGMHPSFAIPTPLILNSKHPRKDFVNLNRSTPHSGVPS
jgi:hypothetical protein